MIILTLPATPTKQKGAGQLILSMIMTMSATITILLGTGQLILSMILTMSATMTTFPENPPVCQLTYVNNICQCQLGIHYKYHSNHSSEQEAAVVTVVAHWGGGQWSWGSIPALHF